MTENIFNFRSRRNLFDNQSSLPFRLSRSKIDLFLNCPRCFYLDLKLGISRPAGFPLSLNTAVDTLLKKEFDLYREKGEPHPLMRQYKIDAVPFKHPELERWREPRKYGIAYRHPQTDFLVVGGVDDIWINTQKELIIVDYKATAKNSEVNLDALWQISYKRQMEIYQWLFRKNNFSVSSTGYFVYVNGRTDIDKFDAKLEFDIKILPYTGDDSWVDEALMSARRCLENPQIPEPAADCEYCQYVLLQQKNINGRNTNHQ